MIETNVKLAGCGGRCEATQRNTQHAGGGWPADVDIIDALDVTNAQLVEEVFVKRVSTDEIILDKDSKEDITFPVRSENW